MSAAGGRSTVPEKPTLCYEKRAKSFHDGRTYTGRNDEFLGSSAEPERGGSEIGPARSGREPFGGWP